MTHRYRLIPFKKDDIPRLISWIPDERALLVWAGPGYEWPLDRDQLQRAIRDANRMDTLSHIMLKFIRGNDVVGHIELMKRNIEEQSAHVGRVLIHPAERGKGLGHELIKAVKKYAAEQYNIRTLTLNVFDFNKPAISIYQKNGFIVTEIKYAAREFQGELWDIICMSCQLENIKPINRCGGENPDLADA